MWTGLIRFNYLWKFVNVCVSFRIAKELEFVASSFFLSRKCVTQSASINGRARERITVLWFPFVFLYQFAQSHTYICTCKNNFFSEFFRRYCWASILWYFDWISNSSLKMGCTDFCGQMYRCNNSNTENTMPFIDFICVFMCMMLVCTESEHTNWFLAMHFISSKFSSRSLFFAVISL